MTFLSHVKIGPRWNSKYMATASAMQVKNMVIAQVIWFLSGLYFISITPACLNRPVHFQNVNIITQPQIT